MTLGREWENGQMKMTRKLHNIQIEKPKMSTHSIVYLDSYSINLLSKLTCQFSTTFSIGHRANKKHQQKHTIPEKSILSTQDARTQHNHINHYLIRCEVRFTQVAAHNIRNTIVSLFLDLTFGFYILNLS